MHRFTGSVKGKKTKVKATSPSSAARKLFKQTRGYKSKGARVISITNSKGRTFRYRVSVQTVNNTVNYEGSASVTFKYRIKVRALGKGSRSSKSKSKTSTKSKTNTKSKTATKSKSKTATKSSSRSKTKSMTLKTTSCTKCKSGKCSKCNHSHSIRPASGGGMFVI